MNYPTTVALDAESHAFPREILECCSSALLLFASGRMGAADGVWVREARIDDVTAVDWDAATLEPFREAYPSEWKYVRADVFEYIEPPTSRKWDLVSADAPSQLAGRLAEMLPRYCGLANRYVTATLATNGPEEAIVVPPAPEGWFYLGEPVYRAEFEGRRYWWLILEREPRLAFDDGPNDETTPAILDILLDHGERAVFFVNGKNIAGREHLLRRMVAEGHEIGNHGWSHTRMTLLNESQVAMEIDRTDFVIRAACGVSPSRFRPPFVAHDEGVLDIAELRGLRPYLESSLGDYALTAGEVASAAALVEGVLYLHDGVAATVEALPTILEVRRGA